MVGNGAAEALVADGGRTAAVAVVPKAAAAPLSRVVVNVLIMAWRAMHTPTPPF